MRNLTQDGHNQGIFFQNQRTFFPIFEKGQERPPLPPPPSSYAPGSSLKSPKVIKLSYFDDCELRFFPMAFKWFLISAYCGLYKQLVNHLVFLMLISMNIASKPASKSTLSVFLEGMSSLTQSKTPPPFAFCQGDKRQCTHAYETAHQERSYQVQFQLPKVYLYFH